MARSFFFDSVQLGAYATDGLGLGYDNANAGGGEVASGGPFNDRYNTNNGRRALGINAASVAAGMWVKNNATGTWNIFVGYDAGTAQFVVNHTSSGALQVCNGSSTVLTSAAGVVTPNVWVFVEVEINPSSAGGTTHNAWVDGTQVITNGTGDTASGTANNYVTQLRFGANNGGSSNGSCYVIGDTAASTATRLGPIKCYRLIATADGTYTQWTASTGNRYQCIDEVPTSNSDTDYISDNTVGHKNSIAITNTVAGIGTIFGFAHYYWARRDDAGPHTVKAFLYDGATQINEATETLGAGYVCYGYIREYSPWTGGSTRFTSAEIDAMELGVEVVT